MYMCMDGMVYYMHKHGAIRYLCMLYTHKFLKIYFPSFNVYDCFAFMNVCVHCAFRKLQKPEDSVRSPVTLFIDGYELPVVAGN